MTSWHVFLILLAFFNYFSVFRILGLQSDLQDQDRINLFFDLKGSTHIHLVDDPVPHPPHHSAFSDEADDDKDESYDDDDGDDDDIGHLLADMSGTVITVPSSSD